jgi:hypothetical protein
MFMLSGQSWQKTTSWLDTAGLKVLDFHPLHIALNSLDTSQYNRMKAQFPLLTLTPENAVAYCAAGFGTSAFFDLIIQRLQREGSTTISAFARRWTDAAIPVTGGRGQ